MDQSKSTTHLVGLGACCPAEHTCGRTTGANGIPKGGHTLEFARPFRRVFGEKDSANVPFSVVSYTNKASKNQQLESIAEVLASDALFNRVNGYGETTQKKFMISCFELDSRRDFK